jgi:ketosteroid isomerase-like protein
MIAGRQILAKDDIPSLKTTDPHAGEEEMRRQMPAVRVNGPFMRILLSACVLWAVPVWAGPDEEAIEKTIKDAVAGAATFSETRDRQSILKLYTDDYQGTQDGEAETKAAIEKWLADYEAELKQGSALRFIGAVSNLRIRVNGTTASALYDYVFQAVRRGEVEGQDTGKCTSLLRKEGAAWLIFHEHCSKTRLNPGVR